MLKKSANCKNALGLIFMLIYTIDSVLNMGYNCFNIKFFKGDFQWIKY